MAERKTSTPKSELTPRRAATTPEGREKQLVNLAVDLAEQQLRDGSASAQVISHYLKAGSSREFLEQQRLAMEVQLMESKRKQMASAERMEELYEQAIDAMRRYQGHPVVEPGQLE